MIDFDNESVRKNFLSVDTKIQCLITKVLVFIGNGIVGYETTPSGTKNFSGSP